MTDAPSSFSDGCRALGLSLLPDQVASLGNYLRLLLEENEKFNLTAIRDPQTAWIRHILDSLTLLPHLRDAKNIIDIGSGGGLPGIPIAIARPDLNVTLLEATGKKALFLKKMIETLPLTNTHVFTARAEDLARHPSHREHYDIATGRAIGELRIMLEYTMPFARVSGRVLAMKGRKAEQELRDAADAITLLGGGDVSVLEALPNTDDGAVIIEITKDRRTPPDYPRAPGTPKLDPL